MKGKTPSTSSKSKSSDTSLSPRAIISLNSLLSKSRSRDLDSIVKVCFEEHKKFLNYYCTECDLFICEECKNISHLQHEGKIKEIEELCNQNIVKYAKIASSLNEIIKRNKVKITQVLEIQRKESLASCNSQRSKGMQSQNSLLSENDCQIFDQVKFEIKTRITEAFSQLIHDIEVYRDKRILSVFEEIDRIFTKKEKLRNEWKKIRNLKDKLLEIVNCLRLRKEDSFSMMKIIQYNLDDKIQKIQKKVETVDSLFQKDENLDTSMEKMRNISIKYKYSPQTFEKLIQIERGYTSSTETLLLFQPNTKNIFLAFPDCKKKKKLLLRSDTIIPQFFEQIQINSKYFICGGSTNKIPILNTLFEFDEGAVCLDEKSRMNVCKKFHSLCAIKDHYKDYLFSIAGHSAFGEIKTMEKYDLANNNWELQPPLNQAREGLCSCALDNHVIYAFGGKAAGVLLPSIEYIDLNFAKLGWKTLTIKSSQFLPSSTNSTMSSKSSPWPGIYMGASLLLLPYDKEGKNKSAKSKRKYSPSQENRGEGQIILFGGYLEDCEVDSIMGRVGHNMHLMSNMHNLRTESYSFDVATQQIHQIDGLRRGDCFIEREKKAKDGFAYAIGYRHCDIHIFNQHQMTWQIIKSDK